MTQLSLLDQKQKPQPEEKPAPIVKRCSSCGSPIAWLRTLSGKAIPVDVDVKWSSPNGRGKRLLLFNDDGSTIQGFECKPKEQGAQSGRQSHFATCPNAEQHRR